jgi:glycosyltransferase involved in cell wall biosynthesis
MKKKILFMLSSMNIGGVEKSLLSLLTVIPKEKYDITVLLLEKTGGFLDHIPSWVTVLEASWYTSIKPFIMDPPQRTLKFFLNNKQYLKAVSFTSVYLYSKNRDNRYLFYKYILRNVPNNNAYYDLAIAFQGPTDIIDFYIANKVNAKKKVSWIHFDVTKHKINNKLYNKLYRSFDDIFIVSEGAKRALVNVIPSVNSKASVIGNIVSASLINKMAEAQVDFDKEFTGMKIVTVGRLSQEKGQDIAIKTMRKLKDDGYNIKWYCIGDGKARNDYENLIEEYNLQESFILVGATPNPYPYIAKSDIYVQTSRQEGYCISLAEARILRKPIVTTNFIGAYEQIKDGNTGFIANNQEDLYQKIRYLLDHLTMRSYLYNNLSKTNVDTTTEINKFLDYIH